MKGHEAILKVGKKRLQYSARKAEGKGRLMKATRQNGGGGGFPERPQLANPNELLIVPKGQTTP